VVDPDAVLVLTPYGVPVLLAADALLTGLFFWRRRKAGSTRWALVVACTLAGLGELAGALVAIPA